MYKITEKVGLVLFIIGFILMLAETVVDGGLFYAIIKNWGIFFWFGMGLWAIGYSQREQEQKDN